MQTPNACVVELAPPTFAGIASLTGFPNGSLKAAWLAATDATPPIRYRIYIQANTATGLFASGNRHFSTEALSADIFTTPNGSPLVQGVNYFVGIRAIDAVGNEDSNSVSLSKISEGVLTSTLAEIANALQSTVEALNGGIAGVVDTDDAAISGVVDTDDEYVSGTVDEC